MLDFDRFLVITRLLVAHLGSAEEEAACYSAALLATALMKLDDEQVAEVERELIRDGWIEERS